MTQDTESQLQPAPRRSAMDPSTEALHESIDENIRRRGRGYLSPDGDSVAVDLLGSARMLKWQERKAAATLLGSFCWSELPPVYGRYGGEESRKLVTRIKALEGAAAAVVTDSGMAAAAVLFDALLAPGDHAIVARSLYNKSKAYLAWLEQRMSIRVTLLNDDEVETFFDRVTDRTRMILVEIFTNPLMRAFEPASLVAAARAGRERSPGLRLVVDDTLLSPWAVETPLLAQGADFVVASGTKALDGRDKNLWGYVASNRVDELNACMDILAMRGGILDEGRCRSVLAGLDRARPNFEKRCRGAAEVARFLDTHPAVSEVFHPSPHRSPGSRDRRSMLLARGLASELSAVERGR